MPSSELILRLGLDLSASDDQIERVARRELEQLATRAEAAPTKRLRCKYLDAAETLKKELAGWRESHRESPGSGDSPLSQTMMRDLPGVEPGHGTASSVPGARLMLEPGQVLCERYEIRRKLGAGGMGAVFAAFDPNRQEEIAIKVVLPGLVEDEEARARFLTEAKTSTSLGHPGIVKCFDVQRDGELLFLTMELLEGETLRDRLGRSESPMGVDRVLKIVRAVGAGLEHAHETTVHRDVKPENVFLTAAGKVKLMDFGIARVLSASQLTMSGAAMGTAYYMAPEQLRPGGEVDHRADQYALAVMTYEMLTGELPTGRAPAVSEVRPEVSRQMSSAIDRALSSRASERFDSVAEFVDAIESKQGSARWLWIAASLLAFAVFVAGYSKWQGWWNPAEAGDVLATRSALERWGEVLREEPDPDIVTSRSIRQRLIATGLPWRVRDGATTIEMVLIPPGEYYRGASPADTGAGVNEKPRHLVRIERPFYLSVREVTNAEYRKHKPDHDSGSWKKHTLDQDNQPVVHVSWNDAQAFCSYFGFQLPSEAEWEYAARAGTTTRYYWGDDTAQARGYANGNDPKTMSEFDWPSDDAFPFDDGRRVSAPVGSYKPNGFGLHDMIGNVGEFCADAYANSYSRYTTRNAGQDPDLEVRSLPAYRVWRGGGWMSGPSECRASDRKIIVNLKLDDPSYKGTESIGFRVVRSVP